MKVAAFPRDSNPYQSLLHEALRRQDVEVDYLPMPTGSQTLNLLLMPVSLLWARLHGCRILHLHWVFGFSLPGSDRLPVLRLFSQVWFRVVLLCCRVLGIHLVWTAHNVLPHDPVFWNDRVARRWLLGSAGHVIVHDERTVHRLADLVDYPDALPPTTVVRHGSYKDWYAKEHTTMEEARKALSLPPDALVMLFFGRVSVQKGILELLAAFTALCEEQHPPAQPILVVAGQCTDDDVNTQLGDTAQRLKSRLRLDLRYLPDPVLAGYLAAADVVVLPFRQSTTSGSVVLALTAARPAVLPHLPSLAEVPEAACIRYDPTDPDGLLQGLRSACSLPRGLLSVKGSVGQEAVESVTWSESAQRTADVYRDVLTGAVRARPQS